MTKQRIVLIFVSIVVVLMAPLLGIALAERYLMLSGGMATEKYMLIMEGCIHGFQIIGILAAAYGLFGKSSKEKHE